MKKKIIGILLIACFIFALFITQVFSEEQNNPGYWKNEGKKDCEEFQYEQALECYKKALTFDPNDADCIYHIGYVLNELERYEEALSYLDRAIEIIQKGKDTSKFKIKDIYYEKGYSLKYLKKYDAAIESYKMALSYDPYDAESLYHIGYILNELEKFNEAISYLDKGINTVQEGKDTSKIHIGDLYNEKGYSLELLCRYEDALYYYDKAVQSDPKWAAPWAGKAYVYYKTKNTEKALECCNKALELNPNRKDAKELKDRILQGQ
jgi:tetratricopeptide (TPR) repeat protein